MRKEVIVLSLGGSLIIPDDINVKFLREFKRIIIEHAKKCKFVIVCGGGSIARKYISVLKKMGVNEKLQNFSGISATRMNARFMNYFFNQDAEKGVFEKMSDVKKYLKKRNIVFCGALEYGPKQTSDSTASQIASELKTTFINLTDIDGLYDKNPRKFKNVKFIENISWKKFHDMANKVKFNPGQHFVLDQKASKIIMQNKIKTYIIGNNIKQLDNFLNGRKFRGTRIEG